MTWAHTMIKLTLISAILLLMVPEFESYEPPTVERTLSKNGFHREISTIINFQKSLITEASECDVMVMELLPSSAYVDPFQLRSLKTFGGPGFLCAPVDVEQPEYLAPPLNVSLYVSPLTDNGEYWTTNATIPVHLRYHRPSSDPQHDSTSIIIPKPLLLLSCTSKVELFPMDLPLESLATIAAMFLSYIPASYFGPVLGLESLPCNSTSLMIKCQWKVLQYVSDSDGFEVSIPVGQTSHSDLVLYGTVLITVLGSIIIQCKTFNWKSNKVKIKCA